MRAYDANRAATVDAVLEADVVANAVRKLMDVRSIWTGTATELLAVLNKAATDEELKSRTWPRASNILAGRLRRAATFLRRTGVDVAFGGLSNGKPRRLTIERSPAKPRDDATIQDGDSSGCPRNSNLGDGEGTPASSAERRGKSSLSSSLANEFNGLGSDDAGCSYDASAYTDPPIVTSKSLPSNEKSDSYDEYDDFRPDSGAENGHAHPPAGEAV